MAQVRQRQSRLFDAYDGMNFSGDSTGRNWSLVEILGEIPPENERMLRIKRDYEKLF